MPSLINVSGIKALLSWVSAQPRMRKVRMRVGAGVVAAQLFFNCHTWLLLAIVGIEVDVSALLRHSIAGDFE